jgi:hypothetical protein
LPEIGVLDQRFSGHRLAEDAVHRPNQVGAAAARLTALALPKCARERALGAAKVLRARADARDVVQRRQR